VDVAEGDRLKMRLHIGSGSVYLDGYKNIDLRGPNTFLASERPDLVAKWKTTDADYYGRHKDTTIETLSQGPLDQEYVCDEYGSFANIPAAYWEASEVLARHSFEHLSITEAHKALDEIDAILKPNGILRLDVPDHDATMRAFQRTSDEFYIRHLLGPRRNDFGFHMMSYSRERLKALVEDHGFVFVAEEPNIHLYEAFCLRFVKPGPRAPRDYVSLPQIPDDWKVLEIGPGAYPLARADVYLDRDIDKLTPLSEQGESTILGDVHGGLNDIPNKTFDYLFCSHVMEHLSSPSSAAATFSRIAKRGTVVVPSTFKEMMFHGEEQEHLWQCLPSPRRDGPLLFVRNNPDYMKRLRNPECQKIASRLYRTGPNRIEEARHLRKWFYENESALDVVHHWEGELRVQVIE
jgi:predicted SAM-dependent methyltransferase